MSASNNKKKVTLNYICGHSQTVKIALSRIEIECDFASSIRCPDCIRSRKSIEVDGKVYRVGDSVLYRAAKDELFREFTILSIDPNVDVLTIVAKNKEVHLSIHSSDLRLP